MTRRRAIWIATLVAVVLVGSVAVVATMHRSGDDLPTMGEARRLLVPAADARRAVDVGDDSPTRGFRTVVFFLADGQYPAFVQAVRGWGPLADSDADNPADIVAVLPHEPQSSSVITPVGGDPTGAIARAYGIPLPDGPPVGYALVDSQLRVRYATPDPHILDHLGRVAAILQAVP